MPDTITITMSDIIASLTSIAFIIMFFKVLNQRKKIEKLQKKLTEFMKEKRQDEV